MLAAVIAGILTLVVIGVVVFVLYRKFTGDSILKAHDRMNVQSISSVGVSGHKPGKSSPLGPDMSTHVNRGSVPHSKPAEAIRSRFVALGVLIAAVFGSLTVKLFSMQIIEAPKYAKDAAENLYTTVSTPAPRGIIYDAGGVEMVKNRSVLTILADIDVADNHDVCVRLAALLGLPYNIVRQRIQDSTTGAQSQRVVASDVKLRDVAFIIEHPDAFPGVTTQNRTTRDYPWGSLAAHALGYTGAISESELSLVTDGRDLEMGDMVGKAGVEATYDDVLSGDHGTRVVVADADGVVRQVVSETAPTKGNDIYLTIRAPIQQVADKALKSLVAPEGKIGTGKGTAASLVCMDCTDGGIIALSNYPTYLPETFIGGISQDVWDSYQTAESHYPLLNRAIAGTYPAASCFKAFTGLAGLTYGFADDNKTWNCEGTWTGFGEKYPQNCWELNGHGIIGLRQGVVVSCDVVFYEIAKSFYDARGSIGIDAMQDFIKEFGYASETGIDIAGEAVGRIPTPEWKAEYFKDAPEQAEWLPGDMSNMVIGQGFVLVTPIQVACAYGAVATGKLLKPHLLKEVRNSVGDTVLSKQAEEVGTPEVSDENYDIMRDALLGVSQEDVSVSAAFANVGCKVGAKTGTAEVEGHGDQAWFACFAPYDNPKYVIAVTVEEGGGGAATASPVAAEVMTALLQYDAGTLPTNMEFLTA